MKYENAVMDQLEWARKLIRQRNDLFSALESCEAFFSDYAADTHDTRMLDLVRNALAKADGRAK